MFLPLDSFNLSWQAHFFVLHMLICGIIMRKLRSYVTKESTSAIYPVYYFWNVTDVASFDPRMAPYISYYIFYLLIIKYSRLHAAAEGSDVKRFFSAERLARNSWKHAQSFFSLDSIWCTSCARVRGRARVYVRAQWHRYIAQFCMYSEFLPAYAFMRQRIPHTENIYIHIFFLAYCVGLPSSWRNYV